MLFKVGLELFESNEVDVKNRFVLGLKKLLLKSISQTQTNKKEKTNKQTKRKKKNKNQAYTKVDLDLNDPN